MTRKRANRHHAQRPRRQHLRPPPGSAPGTLNIDPAAPRPVIKVMAYGPDGLVEMNGVELSALPELLSKWPVTWVNVDGLGDAETIHRLGDIFGLHKLALEDVVSVHQRAKVEQYEQHLFLVARVVELHERIESDQISLFLGKQFVLTFQANAGDSFDPVRERLRRGKGNIRALGPDYLAYALVDAIVDAYFPLIELYGERMEDLEDEVIVQPRRSTVARVHDLRRELLAIRRAVWPLRDAINTLVRDATDLISTETRLFMRDCYDHTVQIIDLVESYRELGASLMETYLSSVSNRTNEVMKVLTIIATIFIPLTFVAGVYGMNFKSEVSPWNMPELGWRWGYPACLGVMAVIAGLMLLFFRRKGWLGRGSSSSAPPTDGVAG
jgi:magnesium transporter